MAKRRFDIVVIGAGVIGLQRAMTLLGEGHRVIIIAEHLPGDTSAHYASPWNVSFEDRSGLTAFPAKLIYENADHRDLASSGDPRTTEGLWFRDFVDGFDSKDSQEAKHYASVQYQSIFVDFPIYLQYLLRKVEDLGGLLIRAKVPEGNGVAGAINAASKIVEERMGKTAATKTVFVNATGLRARYICGDMVVHPVRGQVLVVKVVAREATTKLGRDEKTGEPTISYIIPRPLSAVTILGGCQQKGNWSTKEDVGMSAEIKERCAALAPGLLTGPGKTFEVVSCQVGLRPTRSGGARVETEAVRDKRGFLRWVVHAYGHGGCRFSKLDRSGREGVAFGRWSERWRACETVRL